MEKTIAAIHISDLIPPEQGIQAFSTLTILKGSAMKDEMPTSMDGGRHYRQQYSAFILIAVMLSSSASARIDPTNYVDPLIGTSDARPMQFPGAALPFGMVKLSPDNQKTGWKAGHDYRIKNIAGFNFIHDYHITGFYVMPVCGDFKTQPGPEDQPDLGYRSRISNETEQARPGHYSVMLDDYGIRAEVSATTRTGIQRYTFPESNHAAILFDLDIPYVDFRTF